MSEANFILFTLVLARVSGLMLTAPVFGVNEVPFRIRAVLAVSLTLLVAPSQWQAGLDAPDTLVHYLVLLGCEAAIGACLGLGVLILIHGMTLAGQLVGQASGLSAAEAFDPGFGESVPLFSRLLFLLTVAVFFCIGGHRAVMAGLLDTFRTIPPGAGQFPASLLDAATTLAVQSFSLGVRAAAPAVTALMLATLSLGLVSRTLPQLNVLSVGFGLNALLAFAVLGLTLGAAMWTFQDEVQPALETILNALQTPLRAQWLT